MKRVLTLFVIIAIILTFANIVMAASYFDVSKDHWAYDVINEMSQKKILAGYPDGSFRPDNSITRAEFAKILVSAVVDDDADEKPLVSFEDIDSHHWAYRYINKANKYLSGYSLGGRYFYFPDNAAVREDIAVALVLALNMQDEAHSEDTLYNFTDKRDISENFRKYIAIAYENGLIKGFEDGTFRPQDKLTRAQVAQLISNALKIMAKPTNTPVKIPVVDIPIESTLAPTTTVIKTTPAVTVIPKTTPTTIKICTIKITAGANGTVAPNGSKTIKAGEDLEITFKANSGYIFDKITLDGKELTTGDLYTYSRSFTQGTYILKNVKANHTFNVTFKRATETIPKYTITIKGGSNGSVSPSGTVSVNLDENLEITFKANSGYIFDKITLDGKELTTGDLISYSRSFTQGTYLLKNVKANHTFNVTFKRATEPIPKYTVTIKSDSNGTVSPNGAVSVNMGEDLTISCKAKSGYHFSEMLVDGKVPTGISISNDGDKSAFYTLKNITSNHTVEVKFAKGSLFPITKERTITVNCGANGTTTSDRYVTVKDGNTYSFMCKGNKGYVVSQIKVNGYSIYGAAQTSLDLDLLFSDFVHTGLISNDGGSNVQLVFDSVTEDYVVDVSFSINSLFYREIDVVTQGNGTVTVTSEYIAKNGNKYIVSKMSDLSFSFESSSNYFSLNEVLVDGERVDPFYTSFTQQMTKGNGSIPAEVIMRPMNTVTFVFGDNPIQKYFDSIEEYDVADSSSDKTVKNTILSIGE